ncbi:helix-turn-helix transcriptional regulator [Neobacillus sp. Marseille-QA0830]
MSPEAILNSYKPMVEFISKIYGKNCEVILHDLRNMEKSIIAISNNHITCREIEGPITGLALKILQAKEYEHKNYITNYVGRVANTDKILKSSTFFIKDEEMNVIGMLCVNIDVTELHQARMTLDNLLMIENLEDTKDEDNRQEQFTPTMEELLHQTIVEVLKGYDPDPSRILLEEKKKIVGDLHTKGVFLLKGAVTEVANRLDTSEPTIYRYLKEFQQ